MKRVLCMLICIFFTICLFFSLIFAQQDPNDPGDADTLYFTAGAPCSSNGDTLYIPSGGGNVRIYINIWNDAGVRAMTVPLVDTCYGPPSNAYLDALNNNNSLSYLGSRIKSVTGFDGYINLDLHPPQVLYGAITYGDTLPAGDGLFSTMVYSVSDEGQICLDTSFYAPVVLTFTNPDGFSYTPRFISKCFYIRQGPLPVPAFNGNPVIGEKNLEVNFTDSSEGIIDSWYWSFGDGYFSTSVNPTHIYKEAGSYNVKLIVTNQFGSDSLIMENYIQVLAKLLVDFNADPTVGAPSLGVQFTDNSIGNVTSWKWYFGDNDSSSLQNPYHEYTSFGTYDVTLIATSINGSDTVTKANFIFAYPALTGDSVRILDVTTLPNQEDVVLPIILSNESDSLKEITVPLSFGDSNSVHVDSVSFTGSLAAHFDSKIGNASNDDGTVLVSLVANEPPGLEQGQGLLAKIYLRVKDIVPGLVVTFDTSFIVPNYSLDFVNWFTQAITPAFSDGHVFVAKADSTPPVSPQNLVASPLESGISLTWTTVTEPDLRLYAIYRNTESFTPDSLSDTLATSTDTFYLDPDVSSGEIYFYRVSAVDSSWNESEYSNEASATFGDTTPPVITVGPTDIATTDSSATIYWKTDEAADGYVEIWEDPSWVPAGDHSDFLLEHIITLTQLTPSTIYKYRVYSTDSLGNDPSYSVEDSFTTASGPDVVSPQIILGPAVVLVTHNSATIEWTTDEIATSIVHYGLEASLPDSIVDSSFVKNHSVTLINLVPDTLYYYQVSSKDPSGNGPSYSDTLDLTTLAAPDTLPPTIVLGPIHSGITHNQAIISWLTDEIATSIVQYGPSKLYGSKKTDSDFVQDHRVILTNLEDSTLYYYRVGSVDPQSNGPIWSLNYHFWTKATPDTLPSIILTGPYVPWVSNNLAQIEWTTDEPSNSRVYYGLGGSYDNVVGSPEYVTEHSVVLTNLQSGTTYSYYVSSTDPSHNTVESKHGGGGLQPLDTGDDQFRTKPSPDVLPPVIISGPYITYTNPNLAIVEWITDETSNSIVEYGLTQSYSTILTYPKATINHSAYITNLNPNTTYHYSVGSVDISRNGPTYSSDFTFTTPDDVLDTDPPVITTPPGIAYIDQSQVIITWETDEPADSYIGYEHIGELAEKIVGESYFVPNHLMMFSFPPSSDSFNVRVFSTDPYGNGPTYSDFFIVNVPTTEDVTPPVLISGPQVVYVSQNSAKIEWETDELSSSFIEYGISEEYTDIEGNPGNDSLHEVILTNLSAATTYHYQIKSADLFANVYLGSDSTFVTASSSDITPPAAPTGLLTSYGNQSLTLFWEENSESDLSGYNLHHGTSISDTLLLIASNLSDTSYKDNGLVNGIVYYYQIAAVDQNSNESPFSEVICSKPLSYILGDYNGDEEIDIVDVVAIVNYLFKGAEGHEPLEAGNVNYDQDVTIADVVYLINYLFRGGDDPCLCTIPEESLARYEQRANAILGLSFPSEEESQVIEVLLDAVVEEEVAGVQIDLVFDPSMLEIKEINTTERTDKLGLYYHTEAGNVKIGMVDIYGVHTMAPGEETILKIKFYKKRKEAGISDAKIENAIVVNTMANELEVEIKPNKVIKTIPQTFSLAQNYPNPFNARTVIMYSLPRDSKVEITIYNILGQRVKTLLNEHQQAGYKSIVWDGTNQKGKEVASGIYFYRIQAGDFVQAKKMLLLK